MDQPNTKIRKCRGNLKKEDSAAIQDNYITLQNELEPAYLSDYLYQKGIFDKDDIDEIKCCSTRKEKATKLIDKLQSAGPYDAYKTFLAGLEKEQDHLVVCLKKSALIRARNERCPSPQGIPRDTSEKRSDPILVELDRLYAETSFLKKENDRLNVQIDLSKKENVKLTDALTELQNDNITLTTEIRELESENEQLKLENGRLLQKVYNEALNNKVLTQQNINLNLQYVDLKSNSKQLLPRMYCAECQSGSSLRNIVQFMSETDSILVKLLETISANDSDKVWQELLVFSAFWNFVKTTKLLLKMKISPNLMATLTSDLFVLNYGKYDYYDGPKHTECQRSMSPLMAAAANASHTTLKTLIDAGADVNAKDILGDTALIYVCKEESTELQCFINKHLFSESVEKCIEELISKGADLDVRGSKGMTALIHCARNGNKNTMKKLLSKVPNLKIQCDQGKTALIYASYNNADLDAQSLEQLIKDSDIDTTDANGDTALLYSIGVKNINVFKSLIRCNPNVNIQNKQGANALMSAAVSGNTIFLAMLMKLNPHLNDKNIEGNTALIVSTVLEPGNDHKCSKLLMAEKGIDLNVQNNEGETALMKATQNHNIHMVESLLAAGANVNLRDNNGKTALKHARLISSSSNDTMQNIIRRLIESGAVE